MDGFYDCQPERAQGENRRYKRERRRGRQAAICHHGASRMRWKRSIRNATWCAGLPLLVYPCFCSQVRFIFRFTGSSGFGVVKGHDAFFRRPVAVKMFPVNSGDGAETGPALASAFRRWQAAVLHPCMARPVELEWGRGWLVREWINGFPLLELLRRRRKLRRRKCPGWASFGLFSICRR